MQCSLFEVFLVQNEENFWVLHEFIRVMNDLNNLLSHFPFEFIFSFHAICGNSISNRRFCEKSFLRNRWLFLPWCSMKKNQLVLEKKKTKHSAQFLNSTVFLLELGGKGKKSTKKGVKTWSFWVNLLLNLKPSHS